MFIKSIKHSIDAQALLEELKNDLEHTKRFKSNRPKFYEGAEAVLKRYIEELERIVNK